MLDCRPLTSILVHPPRGPCAHWLRRDFLGLALWAVPGFRALAEAGPEGVRPATVVIDGLGEIHLDYDDGLLDAIRASGLRCCVVTLGNPALHGPEAFEDFRSEQHVYESHVASHPDRLSRVLRVADIDRAAERGTIGLLYYLQNATPINDDLDRLATLKDLGVRIIQLTYNTRNLLGDGCLERTNAGLSRFGLEVVERMNELGLAVDVSHCGPATTLEAIAASRRPALVTHAGCKAVYGHPRNKEDGALRALAEGGGVIGIFQINPYLGGKERNTLEDYLAHVDHAVKVAGIDHVGIGSDREHREVPDTLEEQRKLRDEISRLRPVTAATFRWPFFIAELNHPRRMETIAAALRRRGYKAADVDKVLGGNFYRAFRESIG